METRNFWRGFTLIELLVVMAIIGVLSVVGLTIYNNSLVMVRDSKRQQDLKALAQALEVYSISHDGKYIAGVTGSLPDSCVPLNIDKFYQEIAPFMVNQIVPTDPFSSEQIEIKYCYVPVDEGRRFRLFAKLEDCSKSNVPGLTNCQGDQTWSYTQASTDLALLAPSSPPPSSAGGGASPPPVSPPPSSPPSSPPPSVATFKRVFVTSTVYDGNLGGLAGADQKCQDRANAASLGGTWKAWLSDNETSAASRLTHSTVPYKLVNGTTVVADNWTDLTTIDRETQSYLKNPINMTESQGSAPTGTVAERCGGTPAWANTAPSGQLITTVTRQSCANWTVADSNERGSVGYVGLISGWWTEWCNAAFDICQRTAALYCFEQ